MPLLTEAQRRRLRANARQPGINYAPAVPLFRPPGRQSGMFTELRAGDIAVRVRKVVVILGKPAAEFAGPSSSR